MKLFDCHCHFHLGPRGLAPLLQNLPPPPYAPPILSSAESSPSPSSLLLHDGQRSSTPLSATSTSDQKISFSFAGAAIMSTHPRDYAQVDACVSTLQKQSYLAVPCYGIHPWFLHEVIALDEVLVGGNDNGSNSGVIEGEGNKDDDWLTELRQRLIDHPNAIVGEIGLDGARWRAAPGDDNDGSNTHNPDNNAAWKYQKRMLSCPMNLQRRAFEQQLVVATELNRPVSIHVVQSWGQLLDSLSNVRELMRQKYERIGDGICDDDVIDDTADHIVDEQYSSIRRKKKKQSKNRLLLPPKIYFHAFSGKAGVLPSLLAAIEKGNVSRNDVYFGFAPAIPNFYSSKTPSIMKQIGIHNLLLETDLEDSTTAWDDLNEGIQGIAAALDMDVCEVANQTHDNAMRFYFEREAEIISSQ